MYNLKKMGIPKFERKFFVAITKRSYINVKLIKTHEKINLY